MFSGHPSVNLVTNNNDVTWRHQRYLVALWTTPKKWRIKELKKLLLTLEPRMASLRSETWQNFSWVLSSWRRGTTPWRKNSAKPKQGFWAWKSLKIIFGIQFMTLVSNQLKYFNRYLTTSHHGQVKWHTGAWTAKQTMVDMTEQGRWSWWTSSSWYLWD